MGSSAPSPLPTAKSAGHANCCCHTHTYRFNFLSHFRARRPQTRATHEPQKRAMSRLHSLLRKKKKPDKCGFCHIVIVKDDKHSGVFYKVPAEDGEEGGTIHQVQQAVHQVVALVHRPRLLHVSRALTGFVDKYCCLCPGKLFCATGYY